MRAPATLLLLLSLLLPAAASTAGAAQGPLAITHVTVIDGTGAPARADVTVVIRDGRIASVGSEPAPAGATVVDGRGRFLIPGLWDMHVHLSWTRQTALPLLVANGVTSVRDLGSRFTEIEDWRSRIAAGVLTGPRIVRVGPILNGKSFNPYQLVPGNPDQTRGVARALAMVGVDALKVHRRFESDSYFALIDEARRLGMPVVGHIPMTVTPEEASDAGQWTIEHVATLFEGTFQQAHPGNQVEAMRTFRQQGAAELFARFVKNHTIFDPTLVTYWGILRSLDPKVPPDPRMRYVAASVKKEAERELPKLTPEQLAEQYALFGEYREYVRLAHRAGVTIVTGSDIAVDRLPGFTLHGELALLVESGLSPLEAIRAATLNSATAARREKELGSIEPGKVADLVLLRADPLADIRNSEKIEAVVLGGRLLDRAALDALLRQAEEEAPKN